MTLNCSNGVDEEYVIVSTKDLKTPTLRYVNLTSQENDIHMVQLLWGDNDITLNDNKYYIVTVANSSSNSMEETITSMTMLNLTVVNGINYTVYVTAEKCGGKLTRRSNTIFIKNDGQQGDIVEPGSKSNAIAIGVSSAVAALVILLIGTAIVIILLVFRKRIHSVPRPRNETDSSDWKELKKENHVGKAITEPLFLLTSEREEWNRSIAAMYVGKENLYFSCCEKKDEIYSVRKYTRQGKYVESVRGFKHVRGIGKDNSDHFYVSDSRNRRLIKFDKNWKAQRIADDPAFNIFEDFFGLVVIRKHVLVCVPRKHAIYVFDHDLNLHYTVPLSCSPYGIAKYNHRLFVTTSSGIIALKINFKTLPEFSSQLFNVYVKQGRECKFSDEHELRSICECDGYIYVVEKYKRILVLEYERAKLKFVTENSSCSPIVVASHDAIVYVSQREYKDSIKAFVSEVTYNKSRGELELKKIF